MQKRDGKNKKRVYTSDVYSATSRRIKRFEDRTVSSVKLDKATIEKTIANIEKVLISKGYSPENARKQAEVLFYKLVQMNYIYHPAEKGVDGKSIQDHVGMNHRQLLIDLSKAEPSNLDQCANALFSVESSIAVTGEGLIRTKGRNPSYDASGVAGFRVENEDGSVTPEQKPLTQKQKQLNDRLFDAARDGAPRRIRSALKQGADINGVDQDGNTAFMLAARYGHPQTMGVLKSNGADVNQKNNQGQTALMMAVMQGRVQTARQLIKMGADLNATDKSGRTVLDLIKSSPNSQVRALETTVTAEGAQSGDAVRAEAEAKKAEAESKRKAEEEAKKAEEEAKKAEEEAKKAEPTDADKQKIEKTAPKSWISAFIEAKKQNKFVGDLYDINQRDSEGKTALHHVLSFPDSFKDDPKLVEKLIKAGADLTVSDGRHTPLETAIMYAPQYVPVLAQHALDLSDNHHFGNGILHFLFDHTDRPEKNTVPLLNVFLKHKDKFDINRRNHDNQTPLHVAIHNGHIEAAKILIKNGADVNAVDNYGNTPLSFAEERKDEALIKLLKEKGAKKAPAKKVEGFPLIDAILSNTEEGTERALSLIRARKVKEGNFDGMQPIHAAVQTGNVEVLTALLNGSFSKYERFCDVNSRYKGDMPLHMAIKAKNWPVAELLIQNGANVNLEDSKGDRSLHMAIKAGNWQLAQLLIQKGADVNLEDANGVRVLSLVEEQLKQDPNNKDMLAVHKLLTDKGAKLSEPTSEDVKKDMLLAVQEKRYEDLKLLFPRLKEIRDVASTFEMVSPALFHAISEKDTKAVDLIFEHANTYGDLLYLTDENNETIWHRIAKENNLEMFDHLNKKMTNTGYYMYGNIKGNNEGKTPLYIATENAIKTKDYRLVEQMILSGYLTNSEKNGRSSKTNPVWLALEKKDYELFEKMVASGCIPLNEIFNQEGKSLTTYVVSTGDEKAYEILKKNEALVLARRDQAGKSALDYQSEHTPASMVEDLKVVAEAKAKSEQLTQEKEYIKKQKERLLTYISEGKKDFKEIVTELKNKNVSLADIKDKEGRNLLMLALHYPEYADWLLKNISEEDKRAMFNDKDNYGSTVAFRAVYQQMYSSKKGKKIYQAVVNEALKYNPDATSAPCFSRYLHMLVKQKGIQDLKSVLCVKGLDLEILNEDGETLLQHAVRTGSTKIVGLLLNSGADINSVGMTGMPPLMIALSEGKADIAKSLIKAGADLNVEVGAGGMLALSIAEESDNPKIKALVPLLKQKGACATPEENRLRLAKEYAKNKNYAPLIEMVNTSLNENVYEERTFADDIVEECLKTGDMDTILHLAENTPEAFYRRPLPTAETLMDRTVVAMLEKGDFNQIAALSQACPEAFNQPYKGGDETLLMVVVCQLIEKGKYNALAELLKAKGLDLAVTDKNGENIYDLIAKINPMPASLQETLATLPKEEKGAIAQGYGENITADPAPEPLVQNGAVNAKNAGKDLG